MFHVHNSKIIGHKAINIEAYTMRYLFAFNPSAFPLKLYTEITWLAYYFIL